MSWYKIYIHPYYDDIIYPYFKGYIEVLSDGTIQTMYEIINGQVNLTNIIVPIPFPSGVPDVWKGTPYNADNKFDIVTKRFSSSGIILSSFSYYASTPAPYYNIYTGTQRGRIELADYNWVVKSTAVNLSNNGGVAMNLSIDVTPVIDNPLSLTYQFTSSSNYTYHLPLSGTTDPVFIDWGFDGDINRYETLFNGIPSNYNHIYQFTEPTTVTILVSGSGITQFGNDSSQPKKYLTSCNSFGDIGLTDLTAAFLGSDKLISVPAVLPIRPITDMHETFYGATIFDGDLSNWDFSKVEFANAMFFEATNFTGKNIDKWNITSTTTNMKNMFYKSKIDGDLSNWNVSGSTSMMNGMFDNCLNMSIENYNNTLLGWYAKGYTSNTFSAKGLIYSQEASKARGFATSSDVGDLYIQLSWPLHLYDAPFYVTYNGTVVQGNLYTLNLGYYTTTATAESNIAVTFLVNLVGKTPYSTPILVMINTPTPFNGLIKEYDLAVPCFNEGTKILYLNKQMVDEYIRIELLRKGDFVKTFKHGYRKIDLIGKNILINNPSIYSKCMYKMEKTDTNGLIEDLIVTGGHSIMVDTMTKEEQELNEQLFWGPTPKLDKKYLLLAAASNQFAPIKNKKPYVYYHLVLENEDNSEARYGIWANGILTETPTKEFFLKHKFI